MKNYHPVEIFKKHNNRNNNDHKNCPCCKRKLDSKDKRQRQHVYPDWCYKLFEQNEHGDIVLKLLNLDKEISKENFSSVSIKSHYSNFWCTDCEAISGKLDSAFKDIMFGPKCPLNPKTQPFHPITLKKETKKKKFKRLFRNKKFLKFYKKDSRTMQKWISSICLRILINEIPNQQGIVDKLYPMMIDKEIKPFYSVVFDPIKTEFMFSPLIIIVDDNFGAINFNFGPLTIIALFDKSGKPNLAIQSEHRTVPTNIKKKTKIPIIKDFGMETIKGLIYDIQNNVTNGTNGCIFIDKRQRAIDPES